MGESILTTSGFFLHIHFGGGLYCQFPGRHLKWSMSAKSNIIQSSHSFITVFFFFLTCSDRSCPSQHCRGARLCLHSRVECKGRKQTYIFLEEVSYSPKSFQRQALSGYLTRCSGGLAIWSRIVELVRQFRSPFKATSALSSIIVI